MFTIAHIFNNNLQSAFREEQSLRKQEELIREEEEAERESDERSKKKAELEKEKRAKKKVGKLHQHMQSHLHEPADIYVLARLMHALTNLNLSLE